MNPNYKLANKLVVFTTVVKEGSFTAAAHSLGLGKAAVSQHVGDLEQTLQTELLHRSGRRFSTSAAGERLYQHGKRMLAALDEAMDELQNDREQASGLLRVTAPSSFGSGYMLPVFRAFRQAHPEIEIDLILDDGMRDLAAERIDVALQMGGEPREEFVVRPLMDSHHVVCMRPSFAAQHPVLSDPRALEALPSAATSMIANSHQWLFDSAGGEQVLVHLKPLIWVNDAATLRELVIGEDLVGVFPRLLVSRELAKGELVEVLTEWHLATVNVYLVYASMRHLPRRTRAFVDFIRAHFQR